MRAFRHRRLGQEGAAIRQCGCVFDTNATGCVENSCENTRFVWFSLYIVLHINIQNILSVWVFLFFKFYV